MPQCWGCIVAVCIASVNGWDSQWQIDTKLSRINGVFSNFPNIRSKGQLPMIMFSFDEQKTTLQIQEQIHNAPKCYWMLTKMQKSLLNLTYAQMFVFSRECIFFAYCISQASEGVPIFFFKKNIFVTINQLKKWHFMCLSLAYPRDSTLGNPGKYLWEYKWINWVPFPWGV